MQGYFITFSEQFSSDSLWPHELQHARPSCPSQTTRVHPNSCASSQWCHPDISYSVVPFSSCPQSLSASGSFPISQIFTWGSQILEFQPQHQSFQWTPRTGPFRMDWLDLLAVQRTLKSLLQHQSSKASTLRASAFFTVQVSFPNMTNGKTIALTGRTFVRK